MQVADPSAELALIEDAAREAGELALSYFGRSPDVWMKTGQSPVSEADLAVDRFLRERLMAARPDYGWLSEETVDDHARLHASRTFVVDPIDGTRAFIDGRDVWCVSIAVVEGGRTLAGVLDAPARGEIYASARGMGATLNGSPMTPCEAAARPRLAGPKAILDAYRARWGEIDTHIYVPSLAYRIAMLAAGRIDGTFVKPRSHDWDLAAAHLILTETGGTVRDHSARSPVYAGPDPVKGALAAAREPLLGKMVRTLAEHSW